MLIQRVNRTDAEKIFLICHNVNGSTATTGLGLKFVGGTAAENISADGAQVVVNAAGTPAQALYMAGIADQDIPDDGYGRVQAWGFVNSVLLSAVADVTVSPIAHASSYLQPGAMPGSFHSLYTHALLTNMGYRYVKVMNTVNVSGGLNYAKAFVKLL